MRARSMPAVVFLLAAASSPSSAQVLDPSWTVTVNGQTVPVGPAGDFRIPNVAAADQFGPDGQRPPDFLSDDFIRVIGRTVKDGRTLYAVSEPFQIRSGETFSLEELTITETPPLVPSALSIAAERSVLAPGETVQLVTTAVLGDGASLDVTSRAQWTVYRTSSSRVATVSRDGLVSARARGLAIITAVNGGATATKRIEVSSDTVRIRITGIVRLPDGSPAAGAMVADLLGRSVVAGADGSFSLELDLPAGLATTITATLESGEGSFSRTIDVTALEGLEVVHLGVIALRRTAGEAPFDRAYITGANGANPAGLAAGDLDGDGKPDLAVANNGTGTVSTFRNRGDGTFEPRIDLSATPRPFTVVLGDLDGDGDREIVLGDSTSNVVSVYPNAGDGTFLPRVPHTIESNFSINGVATGDLDGDGDLDLAVSATSATGGVASILLNEGNGTFALSVPYDAGTSVRFVAAGDLDGDGDLDLAVLNTPGTVSILLNQGNGTFLPRVPYPSGPTLAQGLAVGDVDGDLDLDIAVASGQVHLLRNHGDGTFAPSVQVGAANSPQWIAMRDLDGDGDQDLAFTNFGARTVTSLRNAGNGTFSAPVQHLVGRESHSLALEDLDGDGDVDLALTRRVSTTVLVLRNPGSGTFPALTDLTTAFGAGNPWAEAGDLEGDGDVDIVATSAGSGGVVSILRNRGEGEFDPQTTAAAGFDPRTVVMRDFNHDGNGDFAVVNGGAANTVSIILSQANGSFAARVPYTVGSQPQFVIAADLDGDTELDLTVPNFTVQAKSILLGVGDGTFVPHTPISTTIQSRAGAAGDLDLDGDLDLALLSFNARVVVYLNTGDAAFAAPVNYTVRQSPNSIVLGDLDGDGRLDAAVANQGNNTASVLLNQGDGILAPQVVHDVGVFPSFVGMVDLSGEGKPDLVVVDTISDTLSVLIQEGNGVFRPAIQYGMSGQGSMVAIGDFDANGYIDLGLVGHNVSTVTLYPNWGQ